MITITICIGSSCHLKGSYDVVARLENLIKENNLEGKVNLQASFCSGNCTSAVCARINNGNIISVNQENVDDFFKENVLKRL